MLILAEAAYESLAPSITVQPEAPEKKSSLCSGGHAAVKAPAHRVPAGRRGRRGGPGGRPGSVRWFGSRRDALALAYREESACAMSCRVGFPV